MRKTTLDYLLLTGLVALAVLLYLSTANYTGIAQKTSAKYVQFLAISMGGLSLAQLLISMRAKRDDSPFHLSPHLPRFFGLLAALLLFGIAFNSLGFFIPAAVFVPAVALLLGQRNILMIALTTIGLLAFVYLIFVVLLGVNLPGPKF